MNKIIKKILIGIGILIGIIILAAAFFFLKFYSETKGMTHAETSRINDTVFSLKDKFVNAYLFSFDQGYLMIDAGFSEKGILTQMEKLGIPPDSVKILLLTHTDSDHTGAVGLFKNAKIYMHKEEEQMVNGQTGKFFFYKPKWKYGPYTLLNSNEILTAGNLHIKIIHTPGHTPGSCCFLINNTYLVTGDNLAYKNGKFGPFNNFFNMDTKRQESAIRILPNLDSMKFVLTGHYGIVKH
jgi:glyoxylase-like metal-dependent hydrolase (beta-lactamase superfamily II)